MLGISQGQSDVYTLQHLQTNAIFNMPEHRTSYHKLNPTTFNVLKEKYNTLPVWICTNTLGTIFTNGMIKPKRGTLVLHQDDTWYFHIGKGNKFQHIPLPTLHQDVFCLIYASQLNRGHHPPFHTIFNAC